MARRIRLVMDEIVVQSKVEFNYQDEAALTADDIDENE
jgi:hypothetical protein